MKNTIKVLGIIALLAVIGFSFAACDNDDGTGDGGDTTSPPAHVHQWGDWTVTKAATCTTAGSKTRTCTLDPTHTETQEIPIDPTAHVGGDWILVKAPTCTTTGIEVGMCIYHPESPTVRTVPIDPTAHDWGNWTQTTDPTCTTAGIETRTCTHNETHQETQTGADAIGHQWNDNWVLTTPPTIAQNGIETDTCAHDASHTRTRAITTVTFDNIPDLETYLSNRSTNTATTAYKISLNVDDLGGSSVTDGSVGLVLYTNRTNKYVSLDLSGSTITSIVNEAFQNCSSLTSVTIPDSVESIGEHAFGSCTSLTSVTIPDSVTSIEYWAFGNCRSLTSVTIGNSVTSIERYAFYSCRSLASITIPNSVTSIGIWAFLSCTSLTSVTFEGTISSSNFDSSAFGSAIMTDYIGDLRTKFYATDSANGTPGTYTRPSGGIIWTKQN